MSDTKKPTDAPTPAAPKKPWRKPRILAREKIEGRANVCDPLAAGKQSGTPSCSVTKS